MINDIAWYLIFTIWGFNLARIIMFIKKRNYEKMNRFAKSDNKKVPINTMESTEDKERKEWKPDRGKYYVRDKKWKENLYFEEEVL